MNGMTGAVMADAGGSGQDGRARMMVFRAFLAQNVAVGCAFGGFGVSVLPLQQLYGAQGNLSLENPPGGGAIARVTLPWHLALAESEAPEMASIS